MSAIEWMLKSKRRFGTGKGPKRHGVNRERSHYESKKAARMAHERAEYNKARARWRAINRAFWSGSAADWDEAVRVVDSKRTA